MQKTISPIDNKVYIEREYDSHKIEETLNNSVKAQISWGQISVKERATSITGTVAKPSKPSVRLTALEDPTIIKSANGIKNNPK